MKKYLICLIMCFALTVSAVNVFAAKFSFGVPEDIGVNMSETYTDGEHTMIPLRTTAENLGYEVVWSSEDMSATVANDNVSIRVYIGEDSYYVVSKTGLGMANPVMVGAAPELKDSKTYVPAVMITMLRHYDGLSSEEPTIPETTGKIAFGVSDNLKIDVSETYKSGEHTMVPVEKAAKNMGCNVVYNDTEQSVVIENNLVSIKIYAGVDSYFVETPNDTMANPVSLGVAPEIKDNVVYAPAAMFNLISLYEIMQ